MARRSYAGGVKGITLTASVTDIATSLPVNSLVGVPDGSGGPFSIVVGKGGPNEEKMLASGSGGGLISISQRGYDGTAPKPHSSSEEVRLVATSIDFDEANDHVNKTQGVHGLDVTDTLVGASKVQTLTGKSMDGAVNTFTNLPVSAMPDMLANVNAQVDAEEAARIAGDNNRYTKAEADAKYALVSAPNDAVTAHEAEADPHTQYLEGDGTASNRLKIADLPVFSSGRHWSAPLNAVLVTDANPSGTIAQVTIPAASANGTGGSGGRLFMVSAAVKGFTTTGTDTDIARSRLIMGIFNLSDTLDGTLGTWLSMAPGEYIDLNLRLTGNVNIGQNGMAPMAVAHITSQASFKFALVLTKISGVNTENSSAGHFTVVQLV